jgi:hypothetical protein
VKKIVKIWRVGRARFNAPDLKSDEESNLPEVRILYSPPHFVDKPLFNRGFFISITLQAVKKTVKYPR